MSQVIAMPLSLGRSVDWPSKLCKTINSCLTPKMDWPSSPWIFCTIELLIAKLCSNLKVFAVLKAFWWHTDVLSVHLLCTRKVPALSKYCGYFTFWSCPHSDYHWSKWWCPIERSMSGSNSKIWNVVRLWHNTLLVIYSIELLSLWYMCLGL